VRATLPYVAGREVQARPPAWPGQQGGWGQPKLMRAPMDGEEGRDACSFTGSSSLSFSAKKHIPLGGTYGRGTDL